jgi:hypothetical protein
VPSVSKKQHNLMAMVANNPAAAKRVGIPQSVGAEFTKADKGMKFGKGSSHARPDLQKVNKTDTRHGKNELFSKGGAMKTESKAMVKKEVDFMKKKGASKSMIKHEESEMKAAKYAKGGSVKSTPMGKVKTAAPSRDGIAVKGKTKGKMVVMAGNKNMKSGGYC